MKTNSPVTEDSFPAGSIHADRRTKWAWLVARFFGAGKMKPGPGTWGSVAAVLIWYVGLRAAHLSGEAVVIASLAGAAVATLVGIPAASIVERESGREDPGYVVIDEVAGQWLTLAAATVDPWHALLALGLFRFFDIVKPWPVRQMERLNGGVGIMVDDLAAGVYGLIVMLIVRHWW